MVEFRAALATAAVGVMIGTVLVAAPATAVVPPEVSVTFTGETAGAKPNGYASAESAEVLFYDTSGANLSVGDYGVQSHGPGLSVGSDDDSALEIRLASPTTGLSLGFGNDDPAYTNPTDLAQLTLYRGATEVGQASVNVNANDVMDQTIGFSGTVLFNRATFQFVNAAEVPLNLTEIVDDILVEPMCTIMGTSANDVLVGTADADVICAESGKDRIDGKAGDDLIHPGPGKDRTIGGPGSDTVVDSGGADTIKGGGGADRIRGAGGNDVILGGGGKDRLTGGPGRDRLVGGAGRDTCDGGTGEDTAKKCEKTRRIP